MRDEGRTHFYGDDCPGGHLDESEHVYTSTACQHRLHDECRLRCKWCEAPCRCDCHREHLGEAEGMTDLVNDLPGINDEEDNLDSGIMCPNDCDESLREAWPAAVRYCPRCGYQEPA